MKDLYTGGVCLVNLDYDLMQQAGIFWLRHPFEWPLDRDGKPTERYAREKEEAERLVAHGFHLFGQICSIGISRCDEETKRTFWHPGVPEWAGNREEQRYYDNVARAAAFLAEDCKDLISYWTLSNEPDIRNFHGDMPYPLVVRHLRAAAEGVHRGNPAAKAGTNLAGLGEYGLSLARDLCRGDGAPFDWIGVDGYMGSWSDGGPEEWKAQLDLLWETAGKPISVSEWGYSTRQSGPNPDPQGIRPYNQDVCRHKHWIYNWNGRPHTDEVQADYITQCMQVFRAHPAVFAEFFFRWSDVEFCWQCGDPMCPAECAWGIVDTDGKPKAGYYALKRAYEAMRAEDGGTLPWEKSSTSAP